MSLSISAYKIYCDRGVPEKDFETPVPHPEDCHSSIEVRAGNGQRARQQAKELGWVRRPTMDYCPACKKRLLG